MGPGADVEDEGLLEPWDEEVGPFADGVVNDSTETVEEDGALAAVDGVEGGVEDGGADAEPEGGASHVRQERHGGLAASHFRDLIEKIRASVDRDWYKCRERERRREGFSVENRKRTESGFY